MTGWDSEVFKSELTPITVNVKNKEVLFEKDEVPNPNITYDELALFSEDIVTKGNASVCFLFDYFFVLIDEAQSAFLLKHDIK